MTYRVGHTIAVYRVSAPRGERGEWASEHNLDGREVGWMCHATVRSILVDHLPGLSLVHATTTHPCVYFGPDNEPAWWFAVPSDLVEVPPVHGIPKTAWERLLSD